MDLQLTGKRAVVTGASRGIGLAVARSLAAEGAAVTLVARDQARLEAAAAQIGGHGQRGVAVATIVCDTGDDASVAAMADRVRSELGGAEILVNCAAQANTGRMDDDLLDEQVNVKVKGYLRCARALAPGMVAGGWGRIVSIAGTAARQTGSVVGSVRNAAVAAMTKNLADEYGPSGVSPLSVAINGDAIVASGGARGSIYY